MGGKKGRKKEINVQQEYSGQKCLLMIAAVVIGTGLVQTPFFRQSIIDREAAMVRDMVNALTAQHGVSADV